jgi:hypothetical protein
MAGSLCSYGWYELFGVIMSLSAGFLYIENCNLLSLWCIVISMKLMDSCDSFSIVNFIDRCNLLNLLSVCSASELCWPPQIKKKVDWQPPVYVFGGGAVKR